MVADKYRQVKSLNSGGTNKTSLSVSYLKCVADTRSTPSTVINTIVAIRDFSFALRAPRLSRRYCRVSRKRGPGHAMMRKQCGEGNNPRFFFGLGSARAFSPRTVPFCSVSFPVAALIYALELLIYAASMEFHECEM